MMLDQAHERQHAMIAEADRYRLLATARRARRERARGGTGIKAAARGRPAGTISSCEPSVAAPVR
jgi:hypothetical protein